MTRREIERIAKAIKGLPSLGVTKAELVDIIMGDRYCEAIFTVGD